MNLADLVDSAAAIRLRQRLQPEGGQGDKIFPPTFAGGVYCWEQRRINGQTVPCVLLDSVASQANRFEEALEAATQAGLELPRLIVRFDGDLADIGEISTLAAPHRVFDAILRDSAVDGADFFKSPLYRQLTACNTRNATALFAHAPSALVFGCWDSTGAAGGSGNKFARALTSEIVGIQAEWGATQGGLRQDPLGISADIEIDVGEGGEWSFASQDTDTSARGKKVRDKEKRASKVNHGNVLVKVEDGEQLRVLGDNSVKSYKAPLRGGVTVDYALQTTVLSLAALRRLRFPVDGATRNTDRAARAVLAGLALVAVTTGRERGCWLRSRCGLVADGRQDFEIIQADGTATPLSLSSDDAKAAYAAAVAEARTAGLPWQADPIRLSPQPKLAELVRQSRQVQKIGG